jgi:hypothetical protein
MTTTVDALVRDIIGSTETSAGSPLIVRWLNNRYTELVNRVKFRHLRQVGELSIPAIVTAGTVTVIRGSVTITPDATAQAAWVTSPGAASHEHWYIRLNTVWYKVSSINALAATITLASAFAEDDISAGSYTLAKRTHSLNANARWTGTFLFDRLRFELDQLSLDELDQYAPSRTLAGSPPTHVTQHGVDASGYLKYEIYPPPAESELIHYTYWSLPAALAFNSTLPQVIDSYALKEGILIDVFQFEKIAAIKLGNIDAAAVYANEQAKQRKIWDDKIKDAIRTSRATDDVTFILQMFRGNAHRRTDQRDARDYIYDNWKR